MIQCKRLYLPAAPEDGYRVLVDRLWPRGVRKTDLPLDEWCKTLTPSAELRKALHSEQIDFATFSRDYRHELSEAGPDALRLAELARTRTVTLLYGAQNVEQNHALVLADFLRRLM